MLEPTKHDKLFFIWSEVYVPERDEVVAKPGAGRILRK